VVVVVVVVVVGGAVVVVVVVGGAVVVVVVVGGAVVVVVVADTHPLDAEQKHSILRPVDGHATCPQSSPISRPIAHGLALVLRHCRSAFFALYLNL
jgi:hypothetical protein